MLVIFAHHGFIIVQSHTHRDASYLDTRLEKLHVRKQRSSISRNISELE